LNRTDRVHTNRARAESFGAVAEAYDRVRPSYPPALIDDMLARGPADALDVGCGTGKAAQLLAERGVPVLGVEVDVRMAAVARTHGIAVEIGTFERWKAGGRRFDLIVSGQAWHWIDPDVGAAKAAALLRSGGLLAPFWNFSSIDAGLRARIDGAYARVAPQVTDRAVVRGGGPATIPPAADQLRRSGLFASVDLRHYPWERDYTRDEWLALIRTHSDHSTLPAGQLAALLDAVHEAIGNRLVHARYVTQAIFARRD
jgi:SAM-dependent methyltransferase